MSKFSDFFKSWFTKPAESGNIKNPNQNPNQKNINKNTKDTNKQIPVAHTTNSEVWVGTHEVNENVKNEIKAEEIKLKDEVTSDKNLKQTKQLLDEEQNLTVEAELPKELIKNDSNDDSLNSDSFFKTAEFNDLPEIDEDELAELEELTQEQEINKQENIETKQRAILIKPNESREAKIIAKRLMENNIVVLNLNRVSEVDFERIKDFISGTLYSLNGDYRKVNPSIAVLLPTKKVDEKYLELVLEKAYKM